MALVVKRIKEKDYYYSFLSYFLVGRSKSFSKYIGVKKPAKMALEGIEERFREEISQKISGKTYTSELIDPDDVIRSILFRNLFEKKYETLTDTQKRKYDIDSTVLFTLTTLTTEDVDVDLNDVRNAYRKATNLTQREQISRNMLNAVESIREPHRLDRQYLFMLHKIAMASFETKSPGRLRNRQVYLHRISPDNPISVELAYRPPHYASLEKLLDEFIEWYNSSRLNPIEKATVAHYKLYKIHPFLDGNKRICRLIFNKTLLDERFPLLNVSLEKERYFEALIESVEKNKAKTLVEFGLKQYYSQIRGFLASA